MTLVIYNLYKYEIKLVNIIGYYYEIILLNINSANLIMFYVWYFFLLMLHNIIDLILGKKPECFFFLFKSQKYFTDIFDYGRYWRIATICIKYFQTFFAFNLVSEIRNSKNKSFTQYSNVHEYRIFHSAI